MVEELLRQAPAEPPTPSQETGAAMFQRGDLVEVRRYGRGVVEEAGATQVTVAFADRSRRTFLPEYVRRASGKGRKPRQAPVLSAGSPSAVATPGPASAGTAPG